MNEGSGNVWVVASNPDKKLIGDTGLLVGTTESRHPAAFFFLENNFSSRSSCLSSFSNLVAIVCLGQLCQRKHQVISKVSSSDRWKLNELTQLKVGLLT
jgi:hypothetical protein